MMKVIVTLAFWVLLAEFSVRWMFDRPVGRQYHPLAHIRCCGRRPRGRKFSRDGTSLQADDSAQVTHHADDLPALRTTATAILVFTLFLSTVLIVVR